MSQSPYNQISNWTRSASKDLINATGSEPKTVSDFDVLISQKNGQISQLRASEVSWRADSNVSCAGKIGKKKTECEQDKKWKASKADEYLAQISALQSEINQLQISKQALIDRQKSENVATEMLASKGISNQALQLQAEGQAKATIESAKIKAESDARIAETTAQNQKAMPKNNSTKIAIIVVVSLISVFTIALIIHKVRKNRAS